MFVLDTDTLTLALLGREPVSTRLILTQRTAAVAVTVVNRIEVLRGRFDSVLKAADGAQWLVAAARLVVAERDLAPYPVLPVSPAAAGHFDRLLTLKSFRRSRADLLIACIALAHGATLVTRNAQDFRAIPALALDDWTA